MNGALRRLLIRVLPAGFRRWVRAQQRRFGIQWPPVGGVSFGELRRTSPVSRVFGLDRGLHISRYYIEKFLEENAGCIRGRVLEFGDPYYTRKFGAGRVTQSDVLGIDGGDPQVTMVADLTRADHIAPGLFDCIICTQTLQMIYDVRAALRQLERILKPGGVLLITTHGISQIGRVEGVDKWGEYWHFTSQSIGRMTREYFGKDGVSVRCYGNVLAATAHLHGLVVGDVTAEELDEQDGAYEVIIGVRAAKKS